MYLLFQFAKIDHNDYDYDYEMVLLRHTISTMYHGINFKSCKKTQYITMKCIIGEQTRKVCCPLT